MTPPASKKNKNNKLIVSKKSGKSKSKSKEVQIEGNAAPSPIAFSGLNPILGSLGVMIGMLQSTDPTTESYELNPTWFQSPYPYQNTRDAITKNSKQIGDLLGQLLGSVSGNALGVPQKDPALLGNWYPIQFKNSEGKYAPTGLYLVSIDNEDGSNAIGLGVLKKWGLPTDSPVIQVDVWGLIPIILIREDGTFTATFAEEDNQNPISIGVALEGAEEGKPLIDENGIEFNGVKFSANLTIQPHSPSFDVTIEVLQLKLAGDPEPTNYSLADLLAITGDQILDTTASLFIGALSKRFPDQASQILYFGPLFGLSENIPNDAFKDTKLPILKWYELLKLVAAGGDPTTPFINWFNAITSDPDLLKGWLVSLGGFLNIDTANLIVDGQGSRNDPFKVPIIQVPNVGQLNFTVASVVVDQAQRFFYPGLSFSGKPIDISSKVQFNMEADLELAKFQLSGSETTASLDLNFRTNFSLTNPVKADLLVEFEGYKVRSLQGGLSLGISSGSIVPYLEMTDVVVPPQTKSADLADAEPGPPNEFGTVNLLSPGQLAEVGAIALSGQLQSFMGLDKPDPSTFLVSLATLIGLRKPTTAGTNWPEDTLIPPFSQAGIADSILDPINAWADYYYSILTYTPEIDNAKAFTYILQSFAALLQTDNYGLSVSGNGEPSDPWLIGISGPNTDLPAYLTAYEAPLQDGTGIELAFGVSLAPSITIADFKVVPSLNLDGVCITLLSGQPASAKWFNSVGSRLLLPNGFSTPSLGGNSFSVNRVQLDGGWNRSIGWGWSMSVVEPTFDIGGTKVTGPSLNYSNQTDWMELVNTGASTFGPFFANVLGVSLMRTNTRVALLTSGTLGLLTDFSQYTIFQNSGLEWSGFQDIPLTSFSNPFAIIAGQLASNFSTSDKARSQLSLLSWTLSSEAEAPTIEGGGETALDPYLCPLPKGFVLPVWFKAADSIDTIGLGLGRSDEYPYPSDNPIINVKIKPQLNILEYDLTNQQVEASSICPSFDLQVLVSSPDGDLINGTLKALNLGFRLGIESGSITFNPIVDLIDATLPGSDTTKTYTFDEIKDPAFADNLKTGFINLLNQAIQKTVEQVKQNSGFQDAYNMLSLLGLTLPVENPENGIYGINSAGWTGLLANPLTYIENQLVDAIVVPDNRALLLQVFEDIFDIEVPEIPLIALELFQAFNLVGPTEQNYPLNPQGFMEFVSSPVSYLKTQVNEIFSNTQALANILQQFTQKVDPELFGYFVISSTSTGVVTLKLDRPIKIGATDPVNDNSPLLEITGSLALDFSNKKLTTTLNTTIPVIGLTLSDALSVTYKNGGIIPDFTASLLFGNGDLPSANPLQIYPLPDDFLTQMSKLIPPYVLNLFLTAIVEDQLLKPYPVAQHIFELLGIAKKEAISINAAASGGVIDQYVMPSLLGIMLHPLDWVLSPEVLGTEDRKFDIVKLVNKLADFPTASYVASDDVTITIGPNTDDTGIDITGLPYKFCIKLFGNKTTGVSTFSFGVDEIAISDKVGSLKNLNFSVNLTENYQPSFSGGLDISTEIGTSLTTRVGFNKTFLLSLASGTGASQLNLQLLPFIGWGKLAGDASILFASQAVELVVPKVLDALRSEAPNLVAALESFGENVPVDVLLQNLLSASQQGGGESTVLENLETAGLAWLKGLFEGTQLPKTIVAVQDVIRSVPGAGEVKVNADAAGLLEFVPSSQLPIIIYFGVNNEEYIGLWVGLEVPELKYLAVNVAPTGIGIDLATLKDIEFDFGLNITVPLEGNVGPMIFLELEVGADSSFMFGLDPIGDKSKPNDRSDLARQLAPHFFAPQSDPPSNVKKAVDNWLLSVIENVLPRYLSLVILNNASVRTWLDYNLFTLLQPTVTVVITPIDLLLATSLIIEIPDTDPKEYALNSMENIADITPMSFLGSLLQTLLDQDPGITILTFNDGKGKIVIGENPNVSGSYGLRLTAPDFKIEALKNIVLQLGATNKEWIKKTMNVPNDLEPGIQFYFPISTSPFNVDFSKSNLILDNVGFDIVGVDGKPIVDLTRFKLGAIEPRVLFDILFDGSNAPTIVFGGSLTLADLGISLAPNQLTSGDGNSENPIASNLLGSGSEGSDEDTDNPPTNPTFSAEVAYTEKLWVNLVSSTGEGNEIVIQIQRAFGPLFVDSLGVGWDDDNEDNPLLNLLFTGNVGLAGLDLSLINLKVGVPVTNPTDFGDYTLGLDGIDITFQGGSVTINAGLLKQDPPLQYTGSAVIKAGNFSILALGSYAQVKDDEGNDVTSLFIFGSLSVPLGGPGFFFITGLAAGFGFNRGLRIPDITRVMEFPLVAGVVNGTLTGDNDPGTALQALGEDVPPEVGQYWIGAGLKFTSYKLLNTAALLFVSFGNDFELNLLGISYASLPPLVPRAASLAYFELAIKVTFKPALGIISAEAQLTPNSFVLTQDCKITGGFAFFIWYKNIKQVINGETVDINAGEFVISLGGYHPQFVPPPYFPAVPRLGIQWNIEVPVGKLSITGGAYFALVPTAIMAGGYLKVLFEAGPIRAWLDAYANFLIEWNPFYFNVSIGITVGVSFGFTISGVSVTLTAELGANLLLEGPPINGHATIDWYVISFTIPFGEKETVTTGDNLATWDDFAEAFLPGTPENNSTGFNSVASTGAAGTSDQIIKWNAEEGLQNSNNNENPDEDVIWVVNTINYNFIINSAIPTNLLSVSTDDGNKQVGDAGQAVGIRPMGFTQQLTAPIVITVETAGVKRDLTETSLTLTHVLDGAPSALWSQKPVTETDSYSQAPSNENMIVPGALMGLSINAEKYTYIGEIPPFPISNLEYTKGSTRLLPFANTPHYPAATLPPQEDQFSAIMNSIMKPAVIEKRNKIYSALSSVSITAPLNPDLSIMASSANLILQDFPVLAPLGIYQEDGGTADHVPVSRKMPVARIAKKESEIASPVLIGELRRYKSRKESKTHKAFVLPSHSNNVRGKYTSYMGIRNKSKLARLNEEERCFNKQLFEGGAASWKIDSRIEHKLKIKGNLGHIGFSFDEFNNITSIKYLSERSRSFTVPEGSTQFTLLSHTKKEHQVVGWQADTKLTKINPVWSMGDGCLVRVQNNQRIRVKNKNDRYGIVEAKYLLEKNNVASYRGELSKGWIKTVLQSADRYVVVLVNSEKTSMAGVEVSVEINTVPQRIGLSKPIKKIRFNKKTMMIFEVPENSESTPFIGVLAYSSDPDKKIEGIYAINEIQDSSRDTWSTLCLNYCALDTKSKKMRSSELSLLY